MPVQVVSDTTHYLPREIVDGLGVRLVSLYLNWQGRADRESRLPDFQAFYDHLRSARELPTTSQPSVGDFLSVYEPILERGDDIVSLHLSGGISGTVSSAQQARDRLVERGVDAARIEVIDAETACGALGAVVMAAAEAARAGGTVPDVAAAARAQRQAMKIWFAVDTLEFLRRGGRVGGAQAWIGTTLQIKPILTFEREILPVERVRTAGRAVQRLIEYLRERRDEGCDSFIVQHIQDRERAQRLVEAGREIYGTEPMFVSEIGPVIGTHVGPGLLGVAGLHRIRPGG